MILREATLDDLPALLGLWRILEEAQGRFRALPLPADAEDRVTATFREAVDDPDTAIVVAAADGRLVGMAVLHVDKPSRMSDARAVEISRMVVDPAYRKRGVAGAFVERAKAFAHERGITWLSARIFSGNDEAVLFWDRAGFAPVYEHRVRRID